MIYSLKNYVLLQQKKGVCIPENTKQKPFRNLVSLIRRVLKVF